MDYNELKPELASLFDSFYSRFVLRDLFGKITPGAIFLIILFLSIISPTDALASIKYFNVWILIIFIAISWLIGIAIQSVGDSRKWIKYHPDYIDKKI